MLLGVAMSAAQTEGGAVDSSWNYWYRKGRIKDGSDITVEDDHWNRWKSDADLLLALGVQTVRVSVDWTRLQPEPGTVDRSAVAHYRKELEYLVSHGIRPLLTIHHFSEPMWFMERGGFMKPENAKHYLRFVGLVVRAFGDLVSDYVTFHEPNYYAMAAYGGLGFPPGDDNIVTVRRVMSVMAGCHIRAYEKIHRMREKMGYDDTRVGVALNAQVFAAVNPLSFVESRSALLGQAVLQTRPAEAFLKGEFHFPMQNLGGFEKGVYADFIGIDYFTRTHCKRPGDDITREYDAKDDIRQGFRLHRSTPCSAAFLWLCSGSRQMASRTIRTNSIRSISMTSWPCSRRRRSPSSGTITGHSSMISSGWRERRSGSDSCM